MLAVAQSPPLDLKQVATLPDSPRDIVFEYIGLIGFADPLRPNVPAAVEECRSAGIRVLMITGDYPADPRDLNALRVSCAATRTCPFSPRFIEKNRIRRSQPID